PKPATSATVPAAPSATVAAPSAKPPPKPPAPKTPAEYGAYLDSWLAQLTNKEEIDGRYYSAEEKAIRNACTQGDKTLSDEFFKMRKKRIELAADEIAF